MPLEVSRAGVGGADHIQIIRTMRKHFQNSEGSNFQSRIQDPGKHTIKSVSRIETISKIQRLQKFTLHEPFLRKLLEDVLQ